MSSEVCPSPDESSPKKVAAKLFILREAQSHFLPSLCGRSPVNCLLECGFLHFSQGGSPHKGNPSHEDAVSWRYRSSGIAKMPTIQPRLLDPLTRSMDCRNLTISLRIDLRMGAIQTVTRAYR